MTVKKEYEIGDSAWIHGISEGKLTKGKVIKKFTLTEAGYAEDLVFYVVEIPTHIDPLLEIRNWFSMSQDEDGPIGMWRRDDIDAPTMKTFFKDLGLDFK